MAMQLPDIDSQSYDDYEQERLRQEIEQKQQSFALQNAINEKIAGLQSIVGGAAGAVGGAIGGLPSASPAAPPPPSVEPAPQLPPAPALPPPPEPTPAPMPDVPASQATPEPAPAPEPVPSPAAPPVVPGAAPPPGAAPAAPPVAPPAAPPAAPTGGGLQDWITSAMGAAARSGADMQQFASHFSTTGDMVGNALGAALKAGADPQKFMSGITAPPAPTPSPGTAQPGTGAVPGGDLVDYARAAAQRAGIDPDIFVRQIQQESGFNPKAKSGAGAIGIAQFMPGTARGMGIDPSDPYAALDAAARMNAQNLKAYGGDYAKMLAAYNAGGGAVEKYGGVPPFEETQRYVKNILGGAGEAVRGAVGAVTGAVRGAAQQISQFGNPQLTNDEAYAACGPAAAVRFASMYGRNPTLREATDLAATVGWTPGSGMAGLGSEKSLMDKLGVATKMVVGGQWDVFAKEALSGNPVTISTPGHYFFADGYDPQSGAFHVGRSGTDLRQGSEWMTPAQMEGVMGKVQGGLLADNPQVPSPSQATTSPTPSPNGIGRVAEAAQPEVRVDRPLTDVYGRLTAAATGRPDTTMSTLQAASVGEPQALEAPPQSPIDRLKSAFGDFVDSLQQQPAGQPAQSQPIPSDVLTNPLGTGNAAQPSAQLTAQPAGGIAERSAAPTIPEQIGSAIAENQANPPLQGVREEIARQPAMLGSVPLPGNPTVGDVLGKVGQFVKPTIGLSDQEIIAQHAPEEVDQVRQIANQLNEPTRRWQAEHPGETLPPLTPTETDKFVADWFRDMDLAMAYAGTHTGPGGGFRPTPGTRAVTGDLGPARPDRMSPRAGAGDVPQSGSEMLQSALQDLEGYPAATAAQIRSFAASADAPASQVASTIRRWMEDNPLATTLSKSPAVLGEQAVREMETTLRTGGGGIRGGVGPEKGQLGLEVGGQPLAAVEPLLPEGAGALSPEMLLPDYVPKSELEARWIERTKANLEAARAARAARGEEPLPTGGYYEPSLLGDRDVAVQHEMQPPGEGEFQVPGAAPTVLAPPLKLPGYVPKDVSALLEDANRLVPHDQPVTDTVLQKLADATGETPDRIRKAWKPSAENDAVLRSASRALDQSAENVARAQDVLKLDPTDAAAQADMVRALARHQALQETVGARRPVAGSMLEGMRAEAPVSGPKAAADQFGEMAKRAKMSTDELAQQLAKVDMSDPAKVASLAKIARNYSFGDRAMAVWYFNLLSDPLTHIRNIVGNTATALTAPIENLGAAAFDPLARKLLGQEGPRERYFGEALANYAGMWDALRPSTGATVDALRYGNPTKTMGELGRLAHEPWTGTPLEFLGVPGRALEAEDAFFRGINKNAALRSEAYRRAGKAGLKGEAFKTEVTKLLNAPDEAMLKAADAAAEYRVFQQQNAAASAVNNLLDKVPGSRLVVPFTRTPMNIMSYMLERSPLGYAGIAKDAWTQAGRAAMRERGAGDLADRLSRATIGSAIMGEAVHYAMDGGITARAPDDPTERDAFFRSGKLEYAIRDPVTGTYHSYKAMQPFAGLLATSAGIADAWNKGRLDDADLQSLALSTGLAVGQGLLDTPWTQGAADTLDLFRPGQQDTESAIQRIANSYAGNAVPGAGLWRAAVRTLDNKVRKPTEEGLGGMLQAAEANFPLTAGNVPTKLDAFGNTVTRPESGILAGLNPFPSKAPTQDPVELELRRLQEQQVQGLPKRLGNYRVEPGFVGKQSTVAGKLPVDLSNTQQRRYQELSGTTAYNLLHTLVGTKAWDDLSDDDKAQKVEQIYSASRELARAQMDPELAQQAFQQLQKGLGQRSERTTPPVPTPVP